MDLITVPRSRIIGLTDLDGVSISLAWRVGLAWVGLTDLGWVPVRRVIGLSWVGLTTSILTRNKVSSRWWWLLLIRIDTV